MAATVAPTQILDGGSIGAALASEIPAMAEMLEPLGGRGPSIEAARLGDVACLRGVMASSRQRALAHPSVERADQLAEVRRTTRTLTTCNDP